MPPQSDMPKMGLEALVDQLEQLQRDRRQVDALTAELYKQARQEGYEPKALKGLLARRSADHVEAAEREALVDAYAAQLQPRDVQVEV